MAYNNGPPSVVTDGLVLYLDAANPRSYVSGSANWISVTGNGTSGSILGATPTTGGPPALSFNDDQIRLNSYIKTATDITISTWFLVNNTTTTQHIWAEGQSGDGFGDQEEIHVTIKTVAPSTFTDHTIGFWGKGGVSLYTPYSASGTFSNVTTVLENMTTDNTTVTASLYINGTFATGSTTILSRSLYNLPLNVGKTFNGSNRQFSGSIATFNIYDRALSAEEVLQNYNALRGRFGV
jgi:hypothetical protein